MSGFKSVYQPEVRQIIADAASSKKSHRSPDAWEDQLLYFMLPDRFSDGNEKTPENTTGTTPAYQASDAGNAVHTDQDAAHWRGEGEKFTGGTLKGLQSKLGYLERLGVTAVWIGPIFRNVAELDTYHGYGVQNFLDIEPRFGTPQHLKDLVAAAHAKGIYVILDIILNHSGNVFEYQASYPHYTGDTFEVKGYYNSAASSPNHTRDPNVPFRTVDERQLPNAFPNAAVWPSELQDPASFTCKGQIRDWNASPEFLDGDFYDLKDIALGTFNPDNFSATPALKTLCESYKFWIAFADIDGFRIDTVKHMGDGPTRYFTSVIHEYAASIGKNKFLLVGEITGDRAFDTVEVTGLDAALGIGGVQEKLWQVPKGRVNPTEYFDLFRNALYLNRGSHSWFRDKVVTMIDDHDHVWAFEGRKARFCSEGNGEKLLVAAAALNLLTLGIPCIYYGTEQAFDGSGGGDGADRYVRETMHGKAFGAFRTSGRHFFDETGPRWQDIARLAKLRKDEMALCRGRQYLREIAGDGVHFGLPSKLGPGDVRSVVAWSRLFAGQELLCAISTAADDELSTWVNVDSEVHPQGSQLTLLYATTGANVPQTLQVEIRNGRSVVHVKVPKGGVVVYK